MFSFKIHDDFKYEIIDQTKGKKAYISGAIILDFDVKENQPNAAKYADSYEYRLLDKFDTERTYDTLDGWPVIVLNVDNTSEPGTYKQRYFIFDDGKSSYLLSISGWAQEQRIVDEMFAVTQNSFAFSTNRELLGFYYFDVPKFMVLEKSSKFIWSGCYNSKEKAISNQIRFNTYPDETVEDNLKEQRKMLKKDKASDIVDESFIANGFTVWKIGGTRTIELKKPHTKVERKILYFIENPKGGVSAFWFTGDEQIGKAMESGMDQMIKTIGVQ